MTCLCRAILRICLEMCLAQAGCAAPTGILWAIKAQGKAMGSVSEGYALGGGAYLFRQDKKIIFIGFVFRRC
jgi:hypothetical protein